jgi:hypothetical protein
MATIESSPLEPPPGVGGQLANITEADRAEIMAQANEVVDFFLNGSGSFTVDGPRKPVVDDPGFDSTVQDLKNSELLFSLRSNMRTIPIIFWIPLSI